GDVPVAGTPDTPGLAGARAELGDPAISGERIEAIAAAHPGLHVELAGHPRSYPDLLDWLESRPDPYTREAVAARRARDSSVVIASPAYSGPAIVPSSVGPQVSSRSG